MSPSRDLRAGAVTDVGRQRTSNEDRFHVDPIRGIFIVVDGVGGHAAGDIAADIAISAMAERLGRETGPTPDRLREAITIANNEIYRLASTRADWHGMACVLTALVVEGDRAFVGHVGDSRLYRITGSTIDKVTPDHSPVGEREDANELSEAEAMRHPRRNEVFRDVGSAPHEVGDADFVFIAEIDVPGDGALVLCSDGLTDLVSSEVIHSLALRHKHAPAEAAQALVDAANAAGGTDNVTVVFVTPHGSRASALAASGQHAGLNRTSGVELQHPVVWALVAGLALLATFAAGQWARANGWPAEAALVSSPTVIVVRPEESIAQAIATAHPGVEILVEPGEYRERLTLASHVRIVSRVPHGATIRLPDSSTPHDAAVVVDGIRGAELRGFRIVGDGAAPLAVGVLIRSASVQLVDLEVIGMETAAFDIGVGEDVTLLAANIHDNAGRAVILRSGSTPRVSNSTFARNSSAGSPGLPTVVAEPGATPSWQHNLFIGATAATVEAADEHTAAAISAHSWFLQSPSRTPLSAPRAGPVR